MKKLMLIVLIVTIFCIGIVSNVTLAKVKFGDWDKWDEEFPPPKSYWNKIDLSQSFFRKIISPNTNQELCVAMNCFMCKNRRCIESLSIILFSPKGENPDDAFEGVSDYQFALVAFPPDKNEKMIIRGYKKGKENLEFLEEWEIPYENNYTVLPALKENKFMLAFKELAIKEGIEEQHSELILNIKLVVFDDKKSKKFVLLLWNEIEMEQILKLFD